VIESKQSVLMCQSRLSPKCNPEDARQYMAGTFGLTPTQVDEYGGKNVVLCGPCFFHHYWLDMLQRDKQEPGTAVIVDGVHYVIGPEKSGSFRGFGGAHYTIEFFDGRAVNSTNLWYQGEVPPEFRAQMPNNARFKRG